MKKKPKKPQPVVVYWLDSVSRGDDWAMIDEIEPEETEFCVSYGVITKENAKAIVVSGHVGLEDGKISQASGSKTVPRTAIVKIQKINKGKTIYESSSDGGQGLPGPGKGV